jgi:hypothetical protein
MTMLSCRVAASLDAATDPISFCLRSSVESTYVVKTDIYDESRAGSIIHFVIS